MFLTDGMLERNAQSLDILDTLEAELRRGGVGTVVLTPGTTGLGAVDDIRGALELMEHHGVRLHVIESDADTVRVLRSVLMKPEHGAWIDPLHERLEELTRVSTATS